MRISLHYSSPEGVDSARAELSKLDSNNVLTLTSSIGNGPIKTIDLVTGIDIWHDIILTVTLYPDVMDLDPVSVSHSIHNHNCLSNLKELSSKRRLVVVRLYQDNFNLMFLADSLNMFESSIAGRCIGHLRIIRASQAVVRTGSIDTPSLRTRVYRYHSLAALELGVDYMLKKGFQVLGVTQITKEKEDFFCTQVIYSK
jgi:hypothetical protein